MNLEIIKLNADYLDKCNKILLESNLGQIYFSNKNTYNILKRGMEEDEMFVVLCKNECAGFIWVDMDGALGKYPYLHLIVVDEKYRNMGIGKYLMDYFENEIARDYDKLFLIVADFNTDAKRLYEKLGYQFIGTIPDFYKKGINEYLMIKTKNN